jgi:hypothetical protein
VCCYRYTRLQFTSSEDLDQITLSSEAVFHEVFEGNCLELLAVDQFLEGVQVDALVLHAIRVRETELRHAALKWLLTTFKTDFALVAGTRLRAFMTTCRGTSVTGAFTATNSLALFPRTICWLEIAEIHG